jgi:hypothetical protein
MDQQSKKDVNRAQIKLENNCVNRLMSLIALWQLEEQKFD